MIFRVQNSMKNERLELNIEKHLRKKCRNYGYVQD